MSRIAHISAAGGSSGTVTVVGDNTPTDDYANPSDALNVVGLTMVWDGATWDRWTGVIRGDKTPSDNYTNPTDALGVVGHNMVWGPNTSDPANPRWSRWGYYGIDDDFTHHRVPGVAIFGRPELGSGETPQQAGVVTPLNPNAEAFHALRVVASDLYRPGGTPVQQRQSDSEVDANLVDNSGIVTPVVWNGTTLDRIRAATGDNMASTGMPASGTMVFDGTTWDRWRGDVNVLVTTATFNNGAETAVSSTAVQVAAALSTRKKLIVQNTGTGNVRIGTTGVTATTGLRLTPGSVITFDNPNIVTNAIFAIREGGTDSIVLAQEIT